MASYLPPTSNYLDQEQRIRLIKSTRKLGAVLGTTPRLVEQPIEQPTPSSFDSDPSLSVEQYPSRSSSRASHRSARIYSANSSVISFNLSDYEDANDDEEPGLTDDMSSADSSPTSIQSSPPPQPTLSLGNEFPSKFTTKKSKFAEPSLFLRLHAPHPHHPNGSTTSFESSLSSPDDLRTAVPRSHSHSHSDSYINPPLTPISPTMDNVPPEPNSLDMKRKKMAKLARTLGENVPPELVFPTQQQPPFLQRKASGAIRRVRSNSVDEHRLSSSSTQRLLASSEYSSRPVVAPREPSKFYHSVQVDVPPSIATKYQQHHRRFGSNDSASSSSSAGGGLRVEPTNRVKGKEYSGEWNYDMEDVMHKLRGLKGR